MRQKAQGIRRKAIWDMRCEMWDVKGHGAWCERQKNNGFSLSAKRIALMKLTADG
jgi:hypothetical protein